LFDIKKLQKLDLAISAAKMRCFAHATLKEPDPIVLISMGRKTKDCPRMFIEAITKSGMIKPLANYHIYDRETENEEADYVGNELNKWFTEAYVKALPSP